MTKIEFPKLLRQLLEDSPFQAPIRLLADRVGEILADNKLPFFPDYTDHGIDHVNALLKSEVDLVPKQVWEGSLEDSDPRLLCDADAAVIIGATLLHDIAMHLRVDGFRELVSEDSRFQPLPWFKENQEGHLLDRPWNELWDDYVREARRFSDRDLTDIIGEKSARTWKFQDLPEIKGQWEANHFLIVGEFIRRYHARLAHEVAIYGFPGLSVGSGDGQFPAMGKEEGHTLMLLADLIGLTARSHGISLRVCKAYLESSPLYPGTPRPMGTAVLYPMALLRVADYLQIDRLRAPAVLLQLRNPQSPISVQEWKKHRAVTFIGPATAPRGRMVTVSTDLSLTLYLQIRDLLAGLQKEMDHSTAILDEAYGVRAELGLNQLNLATRRVYSNLQSPAFRDSLPYVPKRTGFTADPNLLTLLVEPLYGKAPGVGVRELIQNAADAVCELEVWCVSNRISVEKLDLPDQDADVLIDFIKRADGSWILRVRDKGIGMKAEALQGYFLRAGASFRRSAEWGNEFLDEKGQPRVARAGRFGIGAFAIFLLGSSFRLWTRHAGTDKSMGYAIDASVNAQIIEIRRVGGLPIGTTIEVEISGESVSTLGLEAEHKGERKFLIRMMTEWFCWDWPKVVRRVFRGSTPEIVNPLYVCPVRKGKLPPEWSVIRPNGFDMVFWTFKEAPALSCNGLMIKGPRGMDFRDSFNWPQETQLERPCIAVLDSAANLPLTTQRYKLSQETVPFIGELCRDTTLSFIAHALICGPRCFSEALSLEGGHPLRSRPISRYYLNSSSDPFSEGLLRWCITSEELVPADAYLFDLLQAQSCLVFGKSDNLARMPRWVDFSDRFKPSRIALLPWFGVVARSDLDGSIDLGEMASWNAWALARLAHGGVKALGRSKEIQVFVSAGRGSHCEDLLCNEKDWEQMTAPNIQRSYFKFQNGARNQSIYWQPLFDSLERVLPDEDVLFVAELKTQRRPMRSPESLIAQIWLECLGRRPIPFDPTAREELVAEASKHSELKRHIDAWRQMKTDGSLIDQTVEA